MDLIHPTVANGMSLPRALNAIRRGELQRPRDIDGLGGLVEQQELPPAPTVPSPRREWLDEVVAKDKAEKRLQEAVDHFEIQGRLRARGYRGETENG
jgi:hypothetical protein